MNRFTIAALAMLCLYGPAQAEATYRNPLALRLASGELAQNCGDPAVLRGQGPGEQPWYLYCTSDPVSRADTTATAGASGCCRCTAPPTW